MLAYDLTDRFEVLLLRLLEVPAVRFELDDLLFSRRSAPGPRWLALQLRPSMALRHTTHLPSEKGLRRGARFAFRCVTLRHEPKPLVPLGDAGTVLLHNVCQLVG